MSSEGPKPKSSGGGGILRSSQHQKSNESNNGVRSDHDASSNRVKFSAKFQRSNVADSSDVTSSRRPDAAVAVAANDNNGGDGYDSDEVEDAIMASGDSFAVGNDDDDDDDTNDATAMAMGTSAKLIEEAKRKRGRVRRREEEHRPTDVGSNVGSNVGSTSTQSTSSKGHLDYEDDHRDNQNDSLITNTNANPDQYENNASTNASCPVEPFNMESEKESGLGYFDGDTYVFRHANKGKGQDDEEDAWLDGFGENGDGDGGDGGGGGGGRKNGSGGGGTDSTEIWKPRNGTSAAAANNGKVRSGESLKNKSKFVNEDATPEDLGRRVVTLLRKDNENDETIMMALTRHGASLRELAAKQSKMAKKKKKRSKSHKGKKEGDDTTTKLTNTTKAPPPTTTTTTLSASSAHFDAEAATEQFKRTTQQTREIVEELTELADALLFGGEHDAYELTRSDWIHRFKLSNYLPSEERKRALEVDALGGAGVGGEVPPKKKSCGYFDSADAGKGSATAQRQPPWEAPPKPAEEVTWEYKGNGDGGAIHGPYTSRQMFDWTSCGYFVGESAVDIRRVGSGGNNGDGGESGATGKGEKKDGGVDGPKETDVDDLMADLMEDDEDEEEAKTEEDAGASATKTATGESSWMRSDRIDFSLYL